MRRIKTLLKLAKEIKAAIEVDEVKLPTTINMIFAKNGIDNVIRYLEGKT